jgi:hypothetical protein
MNGLPVIEAVLIAKARKYLHYAHRRETAADDAQMLCTMPVRDGDRHMRSIGGLAAVQLPLSAAVFRLYDEAASPIRTLRDKRPLVRPLGYEAIN